MSKIIFMKYLPPVRSKLFPKLQNAQNLFIFGTSDIRHMLIQIKKMWNLNFPFLSQNEKYQNLLKYVAFDISIITLIYWYIYGEEYWLFKKL